MPILVSLFVGSVLHRRSELLSSFIYSSAQSAFASSPNLPYCLIVFILHYTADRGTFIATQIFDDCIDKLSFPPAQLRLNFFYYYCASVLRTHFLPILSRKACANYSQNTTHPSPSILLLIDSYFPAIARNPLRHDCQSG